MGVQRPDWFPSKNIEDQTFTQAFKIVFNYLYTIVQSCQRKLAVKTEGCAMNYCKLEWATKIKCKLNNFWDRNLMNYFYCFHSFNIFVLFLYIPYTIYTVYYICTACEEAQCATVWCIRPGVLFWHGTVLL